MQSSSLSTGLANIYQINHSLCHRIYRECVLEISILAVLGQEVWLQKGEASEFKHWVELGSRIANGKHPLSQLYFYLPVSLFIGREHS